MPVIKSVVFDIGETLVDETRHWGEWADWLDIPRFTFFAVFGGVIARGEHHRRVFDILRPRLDMSAEQRRREATGWRYGFKLGDFYPDAVSCLARLRAAGYGVGLAGNQPAEAEQSMAAAGVSVDFVAASARWSVEKPSPAFFAKVCETSGLAPAQIAYVGDRLDNDVSPARAAGMTAIFLRRGPWGNLAAHESAAAQAHAMIDTLDELPEVFARIADPCESRGVPL